MISLGRRHEAPAMKLGCQVAAHLAPITIIVIVKFVAAFATITTAGTLPRPRQVYATQQSLSFFVGGGGAAAPPQPSVSCRPSAS